MAYALDNMNQQKDVPARTNTAGYADTLSQCLSASRMTKRVRSELGRGAGAFAAGAFRLRAFLQGVLRYVQAHAGEAKDMRPWNRGIHWINLHAIVFANMLAARPPPRQQGGQAALPGSGGPQAPSDILLPDDATTLQILQWPTWAAQTLGLWWTDHFQACARSLARGGALSASPSTAPATSQRQTDDGHDRAGSWPRCDAASTPSALNHTACSQSTAQLAAPAAGGCCWTLSAPTAAATMNHRTTLFCYAVTFQDNRRSAAQV